MMTTQWLGWGKDSCEEDKVDGDNIEAGYHPWKQKWTTQKQGRGNSDHSLVSTDKCVRTYTISVYVVRTSIIRFI